MLQWAATQMDFLIRYATFSPDSQIYAVHMSDDTDVYQRWWEERSAETGARISKARVPNVYPETANGYLAHTRGSNHGGLRVPNIYQGIFYGREEVSLIPDQAEWTEQAQIGDTHLVLVSSTHGVIILKAPQDVHSFGAHYTD